MNRAFGLSLPEILVVLAILGTVVFVANGFIQTDVREHERLQLATDQERMLLVTTALLREQISPAGSGVPAIPATIHFGCKDRQLEVFVTYIDTSIAVPELRHWYLTVINNREGARLTRATYNPSTMKNDARQPMVAGIAALRLHAITIHDGNVWRAADIPAGTTVATRLAELVVHTDGGLSGSSHIALPLEPNVAFTSNWGPVCAE